MSGRHKDSPYYLLVLLEGSQLVLLFLLLLQTDVISVTGGKNAARIKQDEDTSFPVKVQGAGVEPFELQVQN